MSKLPSWLPWYLKRLIFGDGVKEDWTWVSVSIVLLSSYLGFLLFKSNLLSGTEAWVLFETWRIDYHLSFVIGLRCDKESFLSLSIILWESLLPSRVSATYIVHYAWDVYDALGSTNFSLIYRSFSFVLKKSITCFLVMSLSCSNLPMLLRSPTVLAL